VIFPEPGGFLLLNLAALGVFASLVTAAFLLRGRPQAHKRLMLMGTLGGLAPPGIARLPFVAGHLPAVAGISMGLLLSGPIYDWATRRRVHPAYIVGFIVSMLGTPPVVAAMAATSPWRSIAARLLG
jgi:hypothetical protein